jgi:hypothetical protein
VQVPADAARIPWHRHQSGVGHQSAGLVSIFLVGSDGRRPCFGGVERLQNDPRWRDNLMFYEYFHGDNGAGLGASHQTGWTGLVADVIRRRHGAYPKASEIIQRLVQGEEVG